MDIKCDSVTVHTTKKNPLHIKSVLLHSGFLLLVMTRGCGTGTSDVAQREGTKWHIAELSGEKWGTISTLETTPASLSLCQPYVSAMSVCLSERLQHWLVPRNLRNVNERAAGWRQTGKCRSDGNGEASNSGHVHVWQVTNKPCNVIFAASTTCYCTGKYPDFE